jgi:hypothetical protein
MYNVAVKGTGTLESEFEYLSIGIGCLESPLHYFMGHEAYKTSLEGPLVGTRIPLNVLPTEQV